MHADNEDIDDTQQDITEQYQIVERKAWETRLYTHMIVCTYIINTYIFHSFHPYIFFNQDRVSLTFLGFKITLDGHLVDPKVNRVMEYNLLTKELRNGLALQGVKFDEDFNAWARSVNVLN